MILFLRLLVRPSVYPQQFLEVRKAAIKRIGGIRNVHFRILLIGKQDREDSVLNSYGQSEVFCEYSAIFPLPSLMFFL